MIEHVAIEDIRPAEPEPPEPREGPAIRVKAVHKTYRLWTSPGARLLAPLAFRLGRLLAPWAPGSAARLNAWVGRHVHMHQALDGISFEVHHGQALGIIGLNGSGKSTLLQIVAGVLAPTAGHVEVRGRVAALLELGSGFNPELTGRENVRINAAILGLSAATIDRRMERILAFADIGDYVDEPVKTYSSGMALRLAFAVQVHTDPDVLIVDEALAVGDAAFQAKAMARIDEILRRGTTLLFVGHDLNAVKAFCHRAMLLERGRIAMEGLPDHVISEYLHRAHRGALQASRQRELAGNLDRLDDGYGLEDACVVDACVNGARHASVRFDAPVHIHLTVRIRPGLVAPFLILDILDGRGLQLTGRRIPLPVVHEAGQVQVRVALRACFQLGIYRVRTRVVDAPALDATTVLARQEGALSFDVVDDSRERFTGLFPVPMEVEVT